MTTGLCVPNVIWCSDKCHPSPLLLKTSFFNKHYRPLYYTRYIGSTCIERIQVDPGSSLSITPKRLLYFLSILVSRLSTTTTAIYGFNVKSSHLLGKIRLLCQIGDLKLEVTCYVIDADTFIISYSDDCGSMPTGSSPPRCTSASNT